MAEVEPDPAFAAAPSSPSTGYRPSGLQSGVSGTVYDKNGRQIEIGDIVKIYHFTSALRRKRHYMYKQATALREWPNGFKCLFLSHLTMREGDGFYVALDGARHDDYEIVQSIDAQFDERPRLALAAGSRRAETSEDLAQCEASQSGGEAATPNVSDNPRHPSGDSHA